MMQEGGVGSIPLYSPGGGGGQDPITWGRRINKIGLLGGGGCPPMLLPQWETLLTLGRVTGGEGVAYRIREYPVQTPMRILMTLLQQNE